MNRLDSSAFATLYKAAYEKCFGHPIANPITEAESKVFANKIFEETGLVIGPKSIKNYSFFILNTPEAREENPSIATLDTLARYVAGAPYSNETQRKAKENHYPYWFQYKDEFCRLQNKPAKRKLPVWQLVIPVILLVGAGVFIFYPRAQKMKSFTDDFSSVADDTLMKHGWFVKSKEETYWNRRNESAGNLTLFTLSGDNWPDSLNRPAIKNLLVRKMTANCFTAEVHLSGFIPRQNWQQAGILLMEDTSFSGKSLRLSIQYNDFYGGFPKSNDISIQAVGSGGKDFNNPEEIAHLRVFELDSANETLVTQNLQHLALRIEKHDKKIRLLYSNGSKANSAFKEIVSRDIDILPQYIALFAIKGFLVNADNIPVRFDHFSYHPLKCAP